MNTYTPVVVAVIGLVIWGLAEGKASEAGRIAYFCGLLATLLSSHAVSILR